MKKEIIAVQIVNNELISVKTEDDAALPIKTLILNMSLDNIEYFIMINGSEKTFKINHEGKIEKPTPEELTKALQF